MVVVREHGRASAPSRRGRSRRRCSRACRPGRRAITSRLIILAASAMSCSTLVNSPLASGWMRSCCRMNCDSVTARSVMASSSPRVRSRPRGRCAAPTRPPSAGNEPGTNGACCSASARVPGHVELLEQEGELLLERARRSPSRDRRRHAPHLALEQAERLLARLVEELLVGVAWPCARRRLRCAGVS